jgi:hypothetical protein
MAEQSSLIDFGAYIISFLMRMASSISDRH